MSLNNNSTLLDNILDKVNSLPSAGTSLNFTVVGGTTEPSNPTENMIWVNTSTTISGWVFSPTEPTSPSPNSVWINVGSSSGIVFNAINNNGIELHPLSVKQYINNIWVDVDAIIYQEEEWKSLINWSKTLMINGKMTENYGTFGNPNRYTHTTTAHDRCTFKYTSNNSVSILSWTHYSGSSGYSSSYAYFANTIVLTDASYIKLTLGNIGNTSTVLWYKLIVFRSIGDNIGNNGSVLATLTIKANTENILDISSISGSCYIGIASYGYSSDNLYVEVKDWNII